jgi:uncharacterized membrane protein YciS (DUF1049 family)
MLNLEVEVLISLHRWEALCSPRWEEPEREGIIAMLFAEATPIVMVNDLSNIFNVYKHACYNYMMSTFIVDLFSCGMLSGARVVGGCHVRRQHIYPIIRVKQFRLHDPYKKNKKRPHYRPGQALRFPGG